MRAEQIEKKKNFLKSPNVRSACFYYTNANLTVNIINHFFETILLLLIQVFRPRTPQEAIQLVSRLLEYIPSARISPLEACAHCFFDACRRYWNKTD